MEIGIAVDNQTPPTGSLTSGVVIRFRNRFGTTARKGVLSLADQAVVSGTSFFTTVMIGRLCGPGELGRYSLGLSLVVLVMCVQESLVSMPYTIYGNRFQGKERARYAGSVLVHHVFLAVLSMTCLGALAALFSVGIGPSGIAPLIGVLVAVIPCTLLREFGRRMAFAHLNITTALLLDLAVAAMQIGGLAVVAAAGLLSAGTAYSVMGLSCAVGGVAWLAFDRARFTIQWPRVFAEFRRNLSLGRWVLAEQLTGSLRHFVVLWMLAFMLGETATGTLQACLAIVAFSGPFMLGVGNVLAPRLARSRTGVDASEMRRVVRKATLVLGVAMGGFCGLIVLFGGELVQLLYGNGYADNGHTIALAAAAALASALGHPAGYGLLAMERANVCFSLRVFALSVTFLVTFCLIGPLGVTGAAYGLLAGSLAGSIGVNLIFRAVVDMTPNLAVTE